MWGRGCQSVGVADRVGAWSAVCGRGSSCVGVVTHVWAWSAVCGHGNPCVGVSIPVWAWSPVCGRGHPCMGVIISVWAWSSVCVVISAFTAQTEGRPRRVNKSKDNKAMLCWCPAGTDVSPVDRGQTCARARARCIQAKVQRPAGLEGKRVVLLSALHGCNHNSSVR